VLHDGLLRITGRAPDEVVFTRNGVPLLAANENAARVKDESHRAKPRRSATSAMHAVGRHAAIPAKKAPTTAALGEDIVSLAQAALRQLGFKAPIASRAVEAARGRVRADVELADLIKEALRHCK
jgi:hypothetical protein